MAVRHDNSPIALQRALKREAMKPGRDKNVGRGSGLTPRVRKAVELMVFGKEEDRRANVAIDDAASAVGLSARTLREALLKPAVMRFHQEMYAALRSGEKPASVRVMAAIRDDQSLRRTAAGQKVQLDAAKALAYEPVGHQVQINTQVNLNGQYVTPGYVIDLSESDERETTIDHSLIDVTEAGGTELLNP
ncbi:hypothetical protein LPJGGPFB_03160 [Ensifer adhaerens]|uniref:hypothetical protein n=1 Tax=Ensifer adhaerens TaxID=106592 RepID=UPI001568958C|nr:hypothetical protein [Ensifer adhaerens]NRP19902.1 hypothetical protein [Ensifer adhaerens]